MLTSKVALPETWEFGNYIKAFKALDIEGNNMFDMLFNSIWYTVGGVFLGMAVSTMVAYVVAKYKFPGGQTIYWIALVTMMIPIVGAMPAQFKVYTALGIIESPLLLLAFAGGFGFNFMVLYSFFKSLPSSYIEAGFIDGAGHFTCFLKIMLPQAIPVVSALAIVSSINFWNDYTIHYFTSRNKSGEQSLFFSWLYADYLYFVNHSEEITAELNTRTELESAKIDGDRIELKFANGSAVDRFRELSSEDKAFFERYQARTLQEPRNSPWGEVQTCRVIANGIYEVSTAGHGGIMISTELAPHILSPEALQKDIREGGYYCYEEDCDACIPLRELYDKGILKQNNGYFAHYLVKSENPESKNGKVPFDKATATEKTEFIQWWNKSLDESLAGWNGEYWQAHERGEFQPNAADHESRAESTDLNAVFDQSELGGAKSRFKGNMDAIRLMNRLYAMNLRKETVTGLFIIISTVRYRVRPINENSFSKC